MSGSIFISYRRDDTKHVAGRLADRLGKTYAGHQIFLDVDGIELGADFIKVLSDKVAECDVLLALIGKEWLGAADADGRRRLDMESDFVRIEVAAALARGVPVIPVLVDGAGMPTAEQLPAPLALLARSNAAFLAHERFGADTEKLLRTLVMLVPPATEKRGWFGAAAKPGINTPRPQAQPKSKPKPKPQTQSRQQHSGGFFAAAIKFLSSVRWMVNAQTVMQRAEAVPNVQGGSHRKLNWWIFLPVLYLLASGYFMIDESANVSWLYYNGHIAFVAALTFIAAVGTLFFRGAGQSQTEASLYVLLVAWCTTMLGFAAIRGSSALSEMAKAVHDSGIFAALSTNHHVIEFSIAAAIPVSALVSYTVVRWRGLGWGERCVYAATPLLLAIFAKVNL